MIQTLKQFTGGSRLFDAVSALLAKLNIEFDRETAEPIDVADLYDGPMPQYLTNALQCINRTYFIGVVNDQSLVGAKSEKTVDETFRNADRYDGMFVFACDAQPDAKLTRSTAAALTRAFNRIAAANPVILIIRQGNLLSLATCERTKYAQEWRQGRGEKIGKVSILRNVNCSNPHRGHVDILDSLGDKAYPTFEELYKHWMEVFSTELLVKKFYNELSDWYAWAIKVMKFPNALDDSADDQKYNAENGIRLVTRLIFIWFLKEKKLIPNEFFDVKALQKIIKDFDPTQKEYSLFGYMSKSSTYYQAILQNLFFAMLNCPITEDGNQLRGFRKYDEDGKATCTGRGDSRLMRYKDYFADSDAFVKLAQKVPFLNGGLFDCLDDPDSKFYLDGFSENNEVRKALCVPNFLFFGESNDIDLSEWYDDKQKKHLKIRGIIDILNSYRFTIEENTPYEQEVSLDPELLGKVFENLLASYNPETKTTARKSTGSYYTPREIVQYMVNESLVAYLKEQVDESLEHQYRQLLDYNDSEDTLALTEEQKQAIMSALYHCKILDPACGSGAFPMGMLQQMVHVLSKLDADNTIWKNVIETKLGQELASTIGHTDEERRELQNDINRNFDLSQNAPDYARKLYLIENCIYGIDIQTIAIQISKLRCFISLVVDQKVNDSPEDNYGIRPLPNLEARFVAANSLIGLRNDLSLANTEAVQKVREELADANHRIFNAKTLKTKRKWRSKVKDLRDALVEELKQTGFVTDDDASLIASWDPFNQNCSSRFFDPEWMFGFKKFDIVIGNPPYGLINKKQNQGEGIIVPEDILNTYKNADIYTSAKGGSLNIFRLFVIQGGSILKDNGVFCEIFPLAFTCDLSCSKLRKHIFNNYHIINIEAFPERDNPQKRVFSSAKMSVCILTFSNNKNNEPFSLRINREPYVEKNKIASNYSLNQIESIDGKNYTIPLTESIDSSILVKVYSVSEPFGRFGKCFTGEIDMTFCKDAFTLNPCDSKMLRGAHIDRYIERTKISQGETFYLNTGVLKKIKKGLNDKLFETPRILMQGITGVNEKNRLKMTLAQNTYCANSVNYCLFNTIDEAKFMLALFNSKLLNYIFKLLSTNSNVNGYEIDNLPIVKNVSSNSKEELKNLVDRILSAKKENAQADTSVDEALIDILVYLLYNLTFEEVQIVDPSFAVEEYGKWLANYQQSGTLPTEAEMRATLRC